MYQLEEGIRRMRMNQLSDSPATGWCLALCVMGTLTLGCANRNPQNNCYPYNAYPYGGYPPQAPYAQPNPQQPIYPSPAVGTPMVPSTGMMPNTGIPPGGVVPSSYPSNGMVPPPGAYYGSPAGTAQAPFIGT